MRRTLAEEPHLAVAVEAKQRRKCNHLCTHTPSVGSHSIWIWLTAWQCVFPFLGIFSLLLIPSNVTAAELSLGTLKHGESVIDSTTNKAHNGSATFRENVNPNTVTVFDALREDKQPKPGLDPQSFLSPQSQSQSQEETSKHSSTFQSFPSENAAVNNRGRRLEPNPAFSDNILVLLMRFTDHESRKLPEPYEYQILWNLRVSKYLEANSYETYNAWFDVIPWQTTDNTELYYSFDKSGRTLELQQAFHPLLDALDAEGMDWSIYDSNGDGILDNLIVLHSGYAAENGKADCANNRMPAQRIWSHAYYKVEEQNWVSANGAYQTGAFTVASALSGNCDSQPAQMGVMIHEYFHALNDLIDLYDTAVNPETGLENYLGKGLGYFDIMANPYGVGMKDENFPTHLSPYSKMKLGWVTPTLLNAEAPLAETYTLRPSELYPDIYQINLEQFFGLEYLLLENRQPKLFDKHLFGSGLVIYHIDDALDNQDYRGFPGQDNWPQNGDHYKVAVVQQDGLYELEQGVNRGNAGDFWNKGSILGPNEDGATYPNTDTYGIQFGVYPTGVVIEVVDQIGDDIVIKVTIPSALSGAPPKDTGGFVANHTSAPNTISGKFEGPWSEGWQEEEEEGQQVSPEDGGHGTPPSSGYGSAEGDPDYVLAGYHNETASKHEIPQVIDDVSLDTNPKDPFVSDYHPHATNTATEAPEAGDDSTIVTAGNSTIGNSGRDNTDNDEAVVEEEGEALFGNLFTNTSTESVGYASDNSNGNGGSNNDNEVTTAPANSQQGDENTEPPFIDSSIAKEEKTASTRSSDLNEELRGIEILASAGKSTSLGVCVSFVSLMIAAF